MNEFKVGDEVWFFQDLLGGYVVDAQMLSIVQSKIIKVEQHGIMVDSLSFNYPHRCFYKSRKDAINFMIEYLDGLRTRTCLSEA